MTLLNPTEERLAGCHRGRSCRQKVSKEWGESTWVERQKKWWLWLWGWKGQSWDMCLTEESWCMPAERQIQEARCEWTVWSKQTNKEGHEERGRPGCSWVMNELGGLKGTHALWSSSNNISQAQAHLKCHHHGETNDWQPGTKINQWNHHWHGKRQTSGFSTLFLKTISS